MKIPATILQQFIGMDDYERRLTIDRLSRELGLSIVEIESEIIDFEQGINSPTSNLNNVELPKKNLILLSQKPHQKVLPILSLMHTNIGLNMIQGDAKERQSNVNQAILCPHCNVGIGIPQYVQLK